MTDPNSIDVLGAGLCGSLLSVMLARRKLAVTLWERQPDPRRKSLAGGRSINLALASRGIRALQHAGIFEPVRKLLVPMRGRMIHHPDGAQELQPYGSKAGEEIYSVSRAELNRILLDCAEQQYGVQIRFDHAAQAFAPDTGKLTMRDTTSEQSVVLEDRPIIAADGAGSAVRQAYGKDSRIAPSEALLEHGYKELTLPAAADGSFQLAPDALHIWPRGGFMMIALPNPGGDFTLTLFLAREGETSFAGLDDAAAVEAFFAKEFADLVPLLPELTEEFARNPVGILGTVRCKAWHDGKVLLIGDAAHAIVPFHGQGMNLAFEDCVLIDQLLEQHGTDWRSVFSHFEQGQLANANAIADMALDNYVEMRDRVRDPDFVLHKKLAFELERRLPDRFIPRYSMVMFHPEIPYAVAQQRGAAQQALLKELARGATTIDDIDIDHAVQQVTAKLPALPVS
ncbi:MAG: NAD(P)/FAD-dependent oxidoreductase [Woeseia sp.]